MSTKKLHDKNDGNSRIIKVVAIVSLVVVILNLLLFSFRLISATLFWVVIIVIALIAFPGLNFLKKNRQ